MAWPKGRPRPEGAGRKVGTPNKKQHGLKERLQAHMLETHGIENYDPIVALADIAVRKSTPTDQKIACHKAIAPYIHSIQKAVEVKVSGGIEVKHGILDQLLDIMGVTVIDNNDQSHLLDVIQRTDSDESEDPEDDATA